MAKKSPNMLGMSIWHLVFYGFESAGPWPQGAQTMGGATQLLDGRPPRQVAIALPAYPGQQGQS